MRHMMVTRDLLSVKLLFPFVVHHHHLRFPHKMQALRSSTSSLRVLRAAPSATRAFGSTPRRALAQPVDDLVERKPGQFEKDSLVEEQQKTQGKPPLMKEFKIYRWVSTLRSRVLWLGANGVGMERRIQTSQRRSQRCSRTTLI